MAPRLPAADDTVESVPDYRAAARHAARSAVERGKPLRVRVTSESMSPWIRAGDAVRVQPCLPEEARPGDVLVVHHENVWVAHRLVRRAPQGWVLKGDANPRADAPLAPQSIVGRVTGLWRESALQDWNRPPWRKVQHRAARWASWHARLSLPLESGLLPRPLAGLSLRLLNGCFRLGHIWLHRISATQTVPPPPEDETKP